MRSRFAALVLTLAAACGQGEHPGTPAGKAPPPAGASAPAPRARTVQRVEHPIPGQYIVVLRKTGAAGLDVDAESQDIGRAYGASVGSRWSSALTGFAATMAADQAALLAQDPAVELVEEDGIATGDATQTDVPWGLDRIDQGSLPLDHAYTYGGDGEGVTAYVVDSGIRTSHSEFGGRASSGFSAVKDGRGTDDCAGHGTHVSGLIGGSTYGVAKAVKLVAVRVLGCDNSGAWSDIISGIDWVTKNHVSPAVANLSLGGDPTDSVDTAVKNLIASGVTVAIAAGNSRADACTTTPARVQEAITVGATDSQDRAATYTNHGTCVDLLAPGTNVLSSYNEGDDATYTMSGTSMATPHVTAVAALYLARNPGAKPADVARVLVEGAVGNKVSGLRAGTPNKLLNTGFLDGNKPPDDASPPPSDPNPPADPTDPWQPPQDPSNPWEPPQDPTQPWEPPQDPSNPWEPPQDPTQPWQPPQDPSNPWQPPQDPTQPWQPPWDVTQPWWPPLDPTQPWQPPWTPPGGWSAPAGCSSDTRQLLGNGDFETGFARPWTASPGVIDEGPGLPAHGGRWKAYLNGFGRGRTQDLHQEVTIPASACSATFTFWLTIATAEFEPTAFDTLTVTVRDVRGAVLGTLATYSNLTPTGGWARRSFDLSAFRGRTIRLQFHGVEDDSLQTSFVVDDVALEVTR